jgi:hypothetical protein
VRAGILWGLNQIIVLALWGCLAVAVLWLVSKPGFWVLALGIGGLASAFTTLASIIHFQIGGALLFFVLMGACWIGALFILMDQNDKARIEREARERRSRRRGLLIFDAPPSPEPPPEQPTPPPASEVEAVESDPKMSLRARREQARAARSSLRYVRHRFRHER